MANKNNGNGNDGRATLRDLYSLIEDVRKELTANQLRLENKFDTLEAGRLTRLEGIVADAQARIATYEGKQSGSQYMIPILISIAIAVFGFFVNRVLN